MKKILVLLLVGILAFSLILAGCTPTTADPADDAADDATDDAADDATDDAADDATDDAVDDAADDANAFIPSRPQIVAPVQGQLDVIDVIGLINAENAENDYPQYDWTFAIHSYDPGYENSAIFADAIRAECAKYGIRTVEAFCEKDVSKYPANYQTFITQEVDLILDVGWVGNGSVVDVAMDAGIPIVTYDVPFDSTRTWTVGGDPSVAGSTIGTHMVNVVNEKWGGEVDAVCVSWSQALGEPMEIRMQSAIDAMKEGGLALPDDIIFWYNSDGETLKSKNIAADFLTAHPDDDNILFAANTGNSAQGILAAIQTAGREDDCMVYSYGAEQVAIDNFLGEENCWVADVGYYVKQYGWLGVNTAIRVMLGEPVGYWVSPENFVIDYDTIGDYKGY